MYKHLYCTYIIANSVWLLVIGAFFTDRFAYLSWCLSPILLMLPLCRARLSRTKIWRWRPHLP